MNGKQLKNSILQWAIQGKLVPQDPNDEPASVLLERIREEKARLVKEKKIKKDKNESIIYRGDDNSYYEKFLATGEVKCIDEEIPFEIPTGWCWTRMGAIGDWGSGSTPQRGNASYYGGNILWLKTGELNNDVVYDTSEKITPKALEECSLRLNKTGDVLIAMYGATIGKVAIAGKEMTTNQACCGCTPILIYNYFLFYYLMASRLDFIKKGEGGAQPNISRDKLVHHIIPLPPIAEQYRIVEKISTVLPYIDKYEKSQVALDKLNAEIVDKLKKSILQEAIQGKLLPQDPSDESASELLARIREEKLQLLKEGKLKKKDITDSVIFKGDDNKYYERLGKSIIEIDEHIPFDIPESWEWTTLDFVSYSVGSRANQVQSKEILKEGYYPVVSQGISLVDGYVNEGSKVIKDLPVILFGDHTRNVKYIDFPFVIGADGTKLHKAIGVYPQFLFLWMLYAANSLRDRGYARHYSLLRNTYIPLPPYNEQIRIVKKYDTALASIMSR